MRMKLLTFLKNWALIVAIIAGVASYFIYSGIDALSPTKAFALDLIAFIQPLLIFAMLFLTFCKVDPHKLTLRKWHLWLLLLQTGLFAIIGVILIIMPHSSLRIILEGAMICLICPTATAGAVITKKLGGDINGITTYTILINLATALMIPAMVPLVHPNPEMTVLKSSLLILSKVFPLLLFPLLAALVVRRFMPKIHKKLGEYQEVSFYLWTVALALAAAVTTRSIVHSEAEWSTQLWLVVISLICCGLQFYLGRKIGENYNDKVTAGQSFGQKNTVLAIWMGYTFFTPITSVAGGFYSIWHNVVNSYQLYKHKKSEQPK